MAAPVSPAYNFHHRFDAHPESQQDVQEASSANLPRASADNYSYPDLDGGQYYYSASPHANAGAAVAPIPGHDSELPNFPEFKSLDLDSDFASKNYFDRFSLPSQPPPPTMIEQPEQASPIFGTKEESYFQDQVSASGSQNGATWPSQDLAAPSQSSHAQPGEEQRQSQDVPLSSAAYGQLERGFSSASMYQTQRTEPEPAPAPVAAPALPAKSSQRHTQTLSNGSQHFSSIPQNDIPVYRPLPTADFYQDINIASNDKSRPSSSQQAPPASLPKGQMSQSFTFPSTAAPAPASQTYSPEKSTATAAVVDSLGLDQLNLSNASHAAPQQNDAASPRQVPNDWSRPSSFFGMERPLSAVNANGQHVPVLHSMIPGDDESYRTQHSNSSPVDGVHRQSVLGLPQPREPLASQNGVRPSSFFGMEGAPPSSAGPDTIPSSHSVELNGDSQGHPSRMSSYNRSESSYRGISTAAGGTGNGSMPAPTGGFGDMGLSGATRPASIAPTINGPLLDHSHLKPGGKAALLSHGKTLELYRQNAKKTNDPNLIYELAVFMIDASKTMGSDDSSGGTGSKDDTAKDELVKEATGLLKKIADRGHPDAQYFLADCYANGIGTSKGKQDFGSAYTYFVLAAKHGHPDAAYRAGTCYEKGWGCRRDNGKALQFYRKAAAQNHPGAMYRLATAELNGELGLKKSDKEGVKWLKRSAEAATPEFPHALHELALLHERGIDNVLFVDPEYSCELLAQAGEMGYAPSAYKLGVNYEYGRMGCPQDGGLSIHMYNIAAQQNHKEACFALTAWYLVGAPGILPQSDTEAYLWAKKAAEQGLAKAEYAVGYFTEMGIGTVKDLAEAKAWYRSAAEHGDKRANQRLGTLAGRPEKTLAGVGAGAKAQAQAQNMTDYGKRGQPTSAPFPGSMQQSSMAPNSQTNYPSPTTMRDIQTAQREQQYLANVAATERAQAQVQARASILPRPPPSNGMMSPPSSSPHMEPERSFPPRPFSQGQAYPSYPATSSAAMSPAASPAMQDLHQMNGLPQSPRMIPIPGSPAQQQQRQMQQQQPVDANGDDAKKKKKWFGRS